MSKNNIGEKTQSMTILFVTLSLSGGGAERVVSLLSSGLSEKENMNVHVLVFKRKEKEYSLAEKVIRHQMDESTYENKIMRLCFIRRTIRDVEPDVVIPFLNEPTMYSYIAKLGMKTRFVATVRNNPEYYVGKGYRGKIIKYITEHADMCMLQTEEQAQYFTWKAKGQYSILPNPIKEEMFGANYKYRTNVHKIISCGRLNKQKNFERLIRVFSKLCEKEQAVELLIYGEGEEREYLSKLITQLDLDTQVRLMGRTENVLCALEEADIFVLSSNYEGMPNALMEALAVGMPCVSMNCPTGPSSLICSGEDGILVESDSEMLDALILLANNKEMRIRMGMEAKAKMHTSYSIEAIVNRFIEAVL